MGDYAEPVQLVYRTGTEVLTIVFFFGAITVALLGLAGAFDTNADKNKTKLRRVSQFAVRRHPVVLALRLLSRRYRVGKRYAARRKDKPSG